MGSTTEREEREGEGPAEPSATASSAPAPGAERAAAALFAELVDCTPEERSERLARHGDPEVVERVNALLAADAGSSPFLAEPWLASSRARTPGLGPGDLVGPWRLEELIGEGGSSVVFRAARADGAFARRVAIKVLKFGFQSSDERRRLARERRILAALDHPGIARLLDGGTTEDGLPWFAVELIEGVELRDHLAKEGSTLALRLELAAQLAQALAAAHAKGIVHRDLKPENVMLEVAAGERLPSERLPSERLPRVRMLDFGLAHARTHEAAEEEPATGELPAGDTSEGPPAAPPGPTAASANVFRTGHGHLLGTVAYMSPEQARGEAATPASDVYSLGLVLRELITGRRAHPAEAAPEEVFSRVVAGQVDPLPAGLDRDLRALLSGLLLPEPTARPTAAAVAERLAGLLARPARRRRRLLAAAAAVLVVAAAAKYGVDLRRERLASREAQRAEELARRSSEDLARFLVEVYEASDPLTATSATVSARQMLDHGADRLAHDLADQPLVRAKLLGSIGTIYCRLGVYDRGLELLQGALAARRTLLSPEHAEAAASETDLAVCLQEVGRLEEAEALLRHALVIRQRVAAGTATPQVADLHNKLGSVRFARGDIPASRSHFERALKLYEQTTGAHSPQVAEQLNDLALVLMNEGRMEQARPLMERSVTIVEAAHPAGDASLATSLNNLAGLEVGLGLYPQAEKRFQRALAMRQQALGPAHPDVAGTMVNLAFMYDEIGRPREAEPIFRQAIAILDQALGPNHPRLAIALRRYADCLAGQGADDRAGPLYERAIGIFERTVGPSHHLIAPPLLGLARVRDRAGARGVALQLAERALAVNQAGFGPDHKLSVEARALLAELAGH